LLDIGVKVMFIVIIIVVVISVFFL